LQSKPQSKIIYKNPARAGSEETTRRMDPAPWAEKSCLAESACSCMARSDTEITQLQFPSDLLSPACRLGQLASASQDTVGWDVWEGATQLICKHLVLHAELVHGKRCVCVCFVGVCRSDWLNRQILSTYTCKKKCEMDRRCEKHRRNETHNLSFFLLLPLLFSPTHALIIQQRST
jgi:hypothetical protein